MRTFYFKARNIGQEKYLTYTMGEETELDEDVLDYCEDNDVKELVDIIYEEDDDYDYLTYDITGKKSLSELMTDVVSSEQALFIVRNVAGNLISVKEQAIHLSYILLNREYVYVGDNNDIFFICVPVENKGSLSVEFKGFLRQLLANMKYNVDEDLSFVGKLLTYINSENFNLRGLVGLAEALMEEAGIDYEEAGTIETDGVEIVNSEPEEEPDQETKEAGNVTDFMSDADDEPLPEIGDDETDEEEEPEPVDEELDSILPTGMKFDESENVIENIDDIGQAKQTEDVPTVDVNEAAQDVTKAEESKAAEDVSAVEESKAVEDIPTVAQTEPAEIPEIAVGNDFKPVTEAVTESKEEPEIKLEPISKPEDVPPVKPVKKEEDLDVIKNKIKELVGDVPAAKTTNDDPKKVKTLADLENMLEESKKPAPKKNVVKVNRAAIIQSIAEHEAETEELSEEELNKSKDNQTAEAKAETKAEEKSEEAAPEPVKTNSLLNAPKAMPYLIRVNT
ncbi:MAG: hypothetical protein IJ054_01380, partial [Lachnospiraceae bacterium]|nr:hypothetical protein [Lachnospiraceae bacterium]